ncbi:MAG: 23S rRNA pseudouridine(1911/1915/1917) synthase RluD [Gammaproteobacteria bacterium]|nr:23S rRNA pseudouridine(1911/1915/1917) synthase RluD [Gammaproteobacteria bacterium]
MSAPKQLIVPDELSGQRIDRVLAQLIPDLSRSKLSAWLKAGHITVNQKQYQPNDKVWGGEEISCNIQKEPAPSYHQAEALPLDIVFEDEHILIINKPPGLIVHPGTGNPNGTLLNALLHHDKCMHDLPRAGIVHRLDKDTSGLLVVAKTLAAHTHLIRQMQAHEIHRQYLTLVYGHLIAGKTISTGFGRDPRNRLKMAVTPQGKHAITHFTVHKQYQYVSLLTVTLETGRTHQIRVHMAHIKHPVVGDPLYHTRNSLRAGMSVDLRQTLTQFPRQALHAQTLAFDHPIHGNALTFTAPIPYDFESLLSFLDEEL